MKFSMLKLYLVVGISVLVAFLSACSSIEFKSDRPEKVALANLPDPVKLNVNWSTRPTSGFGKREVGLKIEESSQYLASADLKGNVALQNKNTGKLIWKRQLAKSITAGPTISGDTMLFATGKPSIMAVKVTDGEKLWEVNTASEVFASPTVAQNMVYINSTDGAITAFNLVTGKQVWRYAIASPALTLRQTSSPVVFDDMVITGFSNGRLIAFNKIEGSIVWSAEVGKAKGRLDLQRLVDISSTPVIVGNRVYSVAYQGNLAATDKNSGNNIWERDIGSHSGILIDANHLYLADIDGNIYALDIHSGDTLWMQKALQGRYLTRPVNVGKYIATADEDGILHLLSKSDGILNGRAKIDGKGISQAVVADGAGSMYVLGNSGMIKKLTVVQ